MDGAASKSQESADRGDYFVKSLERGFAVIKAFSAEAPELTLSDIARRTGMTRAAARRFLLTLSDLGYVGVTDRRFHLRPAVLELGFTYLSMLSLPQLAMRHLTELSEQLQETTSMAVLDGQDIVYVARVGGRRVMTSGIAVGTRMPAFLSSHGRMLLSSLPDDELDAFLAQVRLTPRTAHTVTDVAVLRERLLEARAQGWCLVDQELEEGVTSIAVPVRGPDGKVLASLNVGTHSTRRTPAALKEDVLRPLLATAVALERDVALMGVQPTARPRF